VTCSVTGATGTVTATVSAFGAETLSGNFQGATVRDVDPYGLGITSAGENTNSPNHAIDNFKAYASGYGGTSSSGGANEAEVLAINFSQAVSLTNVAVAWTYSDSDAMIFRWDGAGAPSSLTSITPDSLPTALNSTSSGWTLVQAGQFSTSSNQLSIGGGAFSSHWLVSTALGSLSGNNDAFKVSAFTGDVCKYTLTGGLCKPPSTGGGPVPEPGTLALTAAAFLGGVVLRRRKRLAAN
jgi:hypothetical protein